MECVQCSAPNAETFVGGETIRVSTAPEDYEVQSSADTVIIVEEKSCNTLVTKELGDLVYEVENSLMKKGLISNRYGLVGYGKHGPNSYTMEGQLLNEASKFNMGVESLKFSSHFTDAMQAIMHSINYPFRSGVAKNIILLQCGRCSDTKTLLYHNVKSLLESRDIKLHILRDQEFKVGNKSPKQKILGIDSARKYVLRNSRDTALDALLTPLDTCTHLALRSNGSIFDSSSLIAKKIRDKKYFLKTVSSRISESAEAHECQVCKCVADETGYATSVCRKCYSEFSDYLPGWLNYIKHPSHIQQEITDNVKELINKADKDWPILSFKA
uniref:Putative apolipophorins-like protein isoform X1 n=1 Tax=Pinctada fucata TaxID=50426 RepID=A0A194ANN9_PINFU